MFVYLLSIFVFIILVIISKKLPNTIFYVSVFAIINPGNIINFFGYAKDSSIISLNVLLYKETFFLFLIWQLIVHWNKIIINKPIKALLIFCLYYLFFYGFILSEPSQLNLIYKHRLVFLSFLMLFPVMHFTQNEKLYLKAISYFSIIFLILYFLSIIYKIPLISYFEYQRLKDLDIQRFLFSGWGFIFPISIFAFVIYIFGLRTVNNKLIYFSSLMMVISVIIGLTRQEIFKLFVEIVIVIIIFYYLTDYKIKPLITKLLVISLVFFITTLLLNSYFKTIEILISQTKLAFEGQKSNVVLHRLEYEIPLHLKLFKENMLFGTGYNYNWHINDIRVGGRGASDVPFTGMLGMIGIIGSFLYFIFKFIFLKYIIKSIKTVKKIRSYAFKLDDNLFLLHISLSAYFIYNIISFPLWFAEFIIASHGFSYFFYFGLYMMSTKKVFNYNLKINE